MPDRSHHTRATVPLGIEFADLPNLSRPDPSVDPQTLTHPLPSPLELRQIAGLTAGGSIALDQGITRMGLSADDVGFELFVDRMGIVTITPGSQAVRLDGLVVDRPTPVGAAVIDVGSARFMVARRRSSAPRRRVTLRTEQAAPEPVIPVPDRHPAIDPDAFDAELVKRVSAARRVVMAQHRRIHPDPSELVTIARSDDGQRWTRRRGDSDFCHVSIAHAECPWQPRFDNTAKIPNASVAALDDLRYLVSASLMTDLSAGPLAVVGDRSACLAVARQIMVSLATLCAPTDLEVAVLAPSQRASAWHWADELPHTLGGNDAAVPILFVDGVEQFDDSLGAALIDSCGAGAVILADDASQLPMPSAMTIMVTAHGLATVIDHRSGATVMGATPLGLTEARAAAAAVALRDAKLGAAQGVFV